MTLPKLEALQTWAANACGASVDGGGTTYVAAADYYWSSTADGGSASLLSAFQTLLAAVVASTTVTLNDATGKVTITWGSGSHTLAWASTTVRDRFGFADDLASSTGETGTKQVEGLWLPNMPASFVRGSWASAGMRRTDRRIVRNSAGVIYKRRHNSVVDNTLRFGALTAAKCWVAEEDTANESAEQFWLDALDVGAPFRYHRDRATDGTYVTYHDLLEEFAPVRRKGNVDASWDWEIPVGQYVHAATGGGI